MNRREMLQKIVDKMSVDERLRLLNMIIADSSEDGKFDSYYDLSDTVKELLS